MHSLAFGAAYVPAAHLMHAALPVTGCPWTTVLLELSPDCSRVAILFLWANQCLQSFFRWFRGV